ADAGPGPQPRPRHGARAEQDAGAPDGGPDPGLQRLHAALWRHVPAGHQQPRRPARAPAATDGADAVADAVAEPGGPRGAASDDGRDPPGRLAAPRARPSVGLHAGDDAALRAERALSLLRRGPADAGPGDGADGTDAADGPPRVAAGARQLPPRRRRPLTCAAAARTGGPAGPRPAAAGDGRAGEGRIRRAQGPAARAHAARN